MKTLTIITMTLMLTGCKFETKEQKQKRIEKETCELAYRYLSECAYELKKVRVAPLKFCNRAYADRLLSYPCSVLVDGLE
jgi:outer membrane lipopolysaccharide assembly protein LptE/RlpB